jgi:hypothetical protein
MMEGWNIGIKLETEALFVPSIPLFQYYNIPLILIMRRKPHGED